MMILKWIIKMMMKNILIEMQIMILCEIINLLMKIIKALKNHY